MKFFNYLTGFCFVLALLAGCKDDEVGNPLPEILSPVADAGNDTTLAMGGFVILDGSESSDPGDKALSYAWTVKTRPEGSTASIESANKVKASFTPDVAGSYTFELTVENDKATDTDEVNATVTNATYAGCVQIEEDINTATTWPKVAPAGEIDYCVKANINVRARLTIAPGVIVAFEEDAGLYIDDAEIIARGTETNRIIFTGKEAEKGYWIGIELSSADSENNIFEYCEISYAGKSDHVSGYKAGLSLRNGSYVKVNNSSFLHNKGYGMVVPSGGIYEFSNNTFSHNDAAALYINADQMGKLNSNNKFVGENGRDGVEVDGASIDEETEQLWPAFADGGKFFILADFTIRSGVKVQEGAVLEFSTNSGIYIDGDAAYLHAVGTADKNIVFTGIDKESGYWKGIEFSSTDNSKNILDYCQVLYAGSDEHVSGFKAGVTARNGAVLTMTNTLISYSGGYGFATDYGGFESFAQNTFSHNTSAAMQIPAALIGKLDSESSFTGENGKDGVEVSGGTIDEEAEQFWKAFTDGSRYFLLEDITIRSGVRVQEGAEFRVSEDVQLYIDGAAAYLWARGTDEKRIVFTGAEQNQHYWKGIEFSSTSNSKNVLNYCVISFGGSNNHISGYKANISLRNGAEVIVTNSHITHSNGWGIAALSSSVLHTDESNPNYFEANTSGDIAEGL